MNSEKSFQIQTYYLKKLRKRYKHLLGTLPDGHLVYDFEQLKLNRLREVTAYSKFVRQAVGQINQVGKYKTTIVVNKLQK